MLLIAAFGWAMIWFARTGEQTIKRRLAIALALVLLLAEIGWHIWAITYGEWTLENGLPLHLCSMLMWITVIALFWQKRALYPLVYFLGIAGSVQGVLTPDSDLFGFPHFRFLQTMVAHGGLVIAGFWVVFVENYRPDVRSIVRVFVGLNIYAAIVYPINLVLGSNYLYVVAKPDTASLLDVFPAWPWYILVLEVLAIGLCAILYLPFSRKPAVA